MMEYIAETKKMPASHARNDSTDPINGSILGEGKGKLISRVGKDDKKAKEEEAGEKDEFKGTEVGAGNGTVPSSHDAFSTISFHTRAGDRSTIGEGLLASPL